MTDSLTRIQFDITASTTISAVPAVRKIVIKNGGLTVRVYAPGASPESVEAIGRTMQALVEEIKYNGN